MFNHQIAQLRRRQVLDELAIRFLEHKREQYRTLEQNAGRIWVQNFPEMWRLTFSQEEAADRDKELQQEKAEWLECMPATRWVSRLPRRVMEQFRVGLAGRPACGDRAARVPCGGRDLQQHRC